MTKPNHFTVTTPIFYVNGSPHLGHAYTSIAADILARFNRLDNKPVLFVSGTDEHGQKVAESAEKKGVSPQQFADSVSNEFHVMQEKLDVFPDKFIRTTSDEHKKAACTLWEKIAAKGLIYKDFYEGWYSKRDEAFIGEDEITIKDGKRFAPSGAELELVKEESYFFKLSEFTDKLLRLYADQPDFIRPNGAKKEVESFVKAGLKDLSISRTSFDWGIPVPGDEKHVMYVWFDALSNYLTAAGYPDTNAGDFKQFWPPSVQIVGKEITRFHCIYWPAFLMAADLPLPECVYAHGWWTVEGEKMSKSLGNVVDPIKMAESYSIDALRYFLIREVPFGGDGSFSETKLMHRFNTELANDLGNLAQRTQTLIFRNAEGKIEPNFLDDADSKELLKDVYALLGKTRDSLSKQALTQALSDIWEQIRAANSYIDKKAPWALAKTDLEEMKGVLWVLAECIRVFALLLQAYIPSSMEKLLEQLGISAEERTLEFINKPAKSRTISKPNPIFPRLVTEGK